jgi:hypothetical protein
MMGCGGRDLGLVEERIAGYSMPVNIATTQGESNIPTKSVAIIRLCIGNFLCSAGARWRCRLFQNQPIGASCPFHFSSPAIALLC